MPMIEVFGAVEFHGTLAFFYRRIDPSAILAFALTTAGIQALKWGIARDTTDIEWWRAAMAGALVTGVSILVMIPAVSEETIRYGPIFGAAFGCAFAVWVVGGMIYERGPRKTWQRMIGKDFFGVENAASPKHQKNRPSGLQPFSRLTALLVSHGARSTPSSRLASRKNGRSPPSPGFSRSPTGKSGNALCLPFPRL